MKMKGYVSLLLAAALLFCLCGPVTAEEKEITVFVNGIHLEPDAPPMIEDGRTLVPLRAVFEAMGAEVDWDGATRTATVVKDGVVINISIDAPDMLKNGERVPLDVPARIVNGRTMIPVRAVAEGLDAKVEWDGENRHVLIAVPVELPFDSLAADDITALKSGEMSLRYTFEHYGLSSYAFGAPELAGAINRRDPSALDAPAAVWNSAAISELQRVQDRSVNTYIRPAGLAQDELTQGCVRALSAAGLAPGDVFGVSYEDVPGVGTMLLVSFHSSDGFMNCKYIGLVTDRNGNLRFFSAETDPAVPYQLVLWETTPNGSGAWSRVDPEREAFFQAVTAVIQRGAPVEITVFGPR